MTIALRTQRARARRGIAFLDQKLGRGWRRKIKRTKLDMQSCHTCILGQLYVDYSAGLDALDLWWKDEALGFDGQTDTEIWLQELRKA